MWQYWSSIFSISMHSMITLVVQMTMGFFHLLNYWTKCNQHCIKIDNIKDPGPCITNVFATRRKNFSRWHRSFQRKLRSHWLKFLRHVAIMLVIQGPAGREVSSDILANRVWQINISLTVKEVFRETSLNHLPLWDVAVNLKIWFFRFNIRNDSMATRCEISFWRISYELINEKQYWFKQWFDAIRQQTLTRSKVDSVRCCHMVFPCHN